MSVAKPDLSLSDIRAAEAVLRDQAVDPAAFAALMDIALESARNLLRAGVHTPAVKRFVAGVVIARLYGWAFVADDLQVGAATLSEADIDLTLADIRAAESIFRGKPVTVEALAALIGIREPSAHILETLKEDAAHPREAKLVALAAIASRLGGERLDMDEFNHASEVMTTFAVMARIRAGLPESP